jgi:hypothetical protein
LHLTHDPLIGYADEEEQLVTVDLHGTNSARAALEKLQTSAQVLVTATYLYRTNLLSDVVPLKADAAVTEDIYFWGFHTTDTHTIVSKTAFATAAPRQGRFPRHSPYQESQDNIKFWE